MADDEFMDFGRKKPRAGRPRGTKNRDEASIETEKMMGRIYKRMQPFMTREQRAYADDVQNGRKGVDALHELELMIRQMSFVFSESSEKAWTTGKATKEFSELANAFRMSLKDYEDIKKARDEKEKAVEEIEQATIEDRESDVKRIEDLVAKFQAKNKTDD